MAARLVALNAGARRALKSVKVDLSRLPFKVGRESRTMLSRVSMSIERRLGLGAGLNDVYVDERGGLQASRGSTS